MESHHYTVEKQARICSIGTPECRQLLIVLHGYGQLAPYFLRKFDTLKDQWHIIAPEGLHRFYLNGFSGCVGASWMTKECREQDIADNMSYLENIIRSFTHNNQYDRVVLLGFSQGGATAARYFYSEKNLAQQLILWASVLPEDIDASFLQKTKSEMASFVLGNEDEFFSKEQQEQALQFYKNKNFSTYTFEGKHDINEILLAQIL